MKRILRYVGGKVVEVKRKRRPVASGIPAIGAYGEGNPLVSQGLGCMPHQVPEMRQVVKEAGLTGVHVRDDGAVELTSRGNAGRRGLMKLRGFHDNDGGYGDG